MTELSHVEHVLSELLFKFRKAHVADPEGERTLLINSAIITLEREWPEECARYKARYGGKSCNSIAGGENGR